MSPSEHKRRVRLVFGLLRASTLALCVASATISSAVAAGIPGYVVLPLVPMSRASQATLRFNVNGQRTMLVLDTGASVTVLNEGFYRRFHSQTATPTKEEAELLARKVHANGQRAEVGFIDSLSAGGQEFGKRPVLLTDLSRSFNQYNNMNADTSVSGLLGEDFLRQYAAIIDWARRGVYFNTDPARRIKMGTAFTRAGWTAVPMTRTNGQHYSVPCTVGGKSVRLLVDTGAQFTTFVDGVVPLNVMYSRDAHGSMNHINRNNLTMTMIGQDVVSYPARVENWKIGEYPVPLTIVIAGKLPPTLLTQQAGAGDPVLGLLGAEVLAKNNAVVDIGGETLYLKRK